MHTAVIHYRERKLLDDIDVSEKAGKGLKTTEALDVRRFSAPPKGFLWCRIVALASRSTVVAFNALSLYGGNGNYDWELGRQYKKFEKQCNKRMDGEQLKKFIAKNNSKATIVSFRKHGKVFQTIGKTVRKIGGGRPKKTTAVNDRYIIPDTSQKSAIAQQLCIVTGRQM
ncbi:hypothetical protein TNCV_939961 [Trichonephila clavipes]|nr:hypothetical protein TNCV_939961 [Trichonephila clavipes]